jgi:hypothetical protein
MKQLLQKIVLPMGCLLLTSCMMQPLKIPLPTPEQAARARANYQANNCNYDTAFEQGVRDADAGGQMNGQYYSSYCPNAKQAVMRGYREGYLSVTNRPGKTSSVIIVNPAPVR